MAPEILRGGMNYDICTEFERILKIRGGKCIINANEESVLFRIRYHHFYINNLEHWISGRFNPNELGLLTPGRIKLCLALHWSHGVVYSEGKKNLIE